MYKKHTFIPIDRFYGSFPKISDDINKKSLIGFNLKPDLFGGTPYSPLDFTRVGYGQYVIEKMTDDIVSCFKIQEKDDIGIIPFDKPLRDIGMLKEFSILKKYSKIKAVFILQNEVGEVLDYKETVSMPSGLYKCMFIGFLVK